MNKITTRMKTFNDAVKEKIAIDKEFKKLALEDDEDFELPEEFA
jgi:hypothetical protein